MRTESKYGMPIPRYREEFEHNVFMLIDEIVEPSRDESIRQNRLMFVRDSLLELKQLPNGRIYLPSVDESVRCFSNSLKWLEMMPKPQLQNNNTKKSYEKK